MTTLTVNLSSALQTTLNQTGIGVWAVYFNNNNVYATELDASVASTPIDLPGDLKGGKVYLLIQSVASGGIAPLTFGPGGIIQQESDINWQSAATYDFRYDSLELSLQGMAGDAGNLTDVNGFGIPMSIEVAYPNGATTQTRGYAVNGSNVFSDIDAASGSQAVYTYSQGPLAGTNRMAASPTTAVSNALPGYAASDWNAYLESLGDALAAGATNPVRIAGYFNGAPSVEWINYTDPSTGVTQVYSYNEYHNPGVYSYTASYANGTYTFTPAANSQIQGVISISVADLANSIYSTLGNATVTDPTTGQPYEFSANAGGTAVFNPYMNTGANNQWGAFFVTLLTGFIGGYLGGTTTAQNSLLGSSPISLSQNWNFDPTFAFGGKITSGPGTVTPWTWAGSYGTGVSYDPYAEIFFNNTNSYGNGYSDALMSQFQQGGPLIPMGYTGTLGNNPFSTTIGSSTVTVTDPNASGYDVGDLVTFAGATVVGGITIAGTNTITSVGAGSYTINGGSNATATATGGTGVTFQKDVDNITLTLFDDNETAPSGQTLPEVQGYTPTLIYDTSSGPFVAPQSSTGAPNLSLVLDFGLGQMRLDPNATIQIGFYTGTSGGVAQFDYVAIPSSSTQSLYQTWVYSNGTFIAGGAPAANGSILNVNGLPYDTGINWYQIVVTNSSATRTYNLYANAVAGTGVLNPYYDQGGVDQSGSLALDGLAQIPAATLPVTQQYTTSLQIAAFNGGTMSMDPLLLTWITDSSIYPSTPGIWPTPLAPVLGTLTGTDDAFANWGGSTNPLTPNASLGDVTDGSLAIGWYGSDTTWIGYNASVGNTNVVGSYTNKVMGLDVALVSFSTASGFTAHNPIVVNADIDGKWTSAASQFGNGTYQAVMTEYQSSDTDFSTPVALTSSPLTFTVNMAELAFANTGGSFIQLDGSSGNASGNWVRLESLTSTMPNGTLLVYATDLDGNLVGRDGETGAGVTFDEAVVARIGSVASDGGALLFQGLQSVYLPVGQQLRFAVQTGNDAIQLLPNVLVTGDDTLTVRVAGTFGTLTLTAEVDNTLSATATSAASQREYDEPWVFLSQGQKASVDIAGSAHNINTIHFVRLDVDRAGNWSVNGVAYGNTDAFRAAVRDNWDAGFASTGGRGNFQNDFDWTASSGTGFYAPVLVTEAGDIFVVGQANVDGRDHIRSFGENTFGFEDLRADQGSDFDYNDLVMKLSIV